MKSICPDDDEHDDSESGGRLMKTIVYNAHQIQITNGLKEQVKYDGTVVWSGHTWAGGTHVFRVKEDGEDVDYEVEQGTRFFFVWTVVRRNGRVIYTDR